MKAFPSHRNASPCPPLHPRPHLTIARLHRRSADPPSIRRWLDQLPVPTDKPVRVSAPALCGWSNHRPAQQFQIIEPPEEKASDGGRAER